MTPLTRNYITRLGRKDKRLRGADLAWDEPGKCIISLRPGLTWDGDCAVRGFVYDDYDGDDVDTVEGLLMRLDMIVTKSDRRAS